MVGNKGFDVKFTLFTVSGQFCGLIEKMLTDFGIGLSHKKGTLNFLKVVFG